ncbi:MAG: alpha/beta fold hydrolase [Oscillospiraceae bacterium]|nr:alpha/beta fold hydrolase [Oscillospiraceae bacterium]
MGIISGIYKKAAIHRYDDNGYIKYFSAADFPGLNAEPFSFLSGKNTLRGYFYSCENCREDALIIFCHGMGGGHRSYMTEIELLCRRGYKVLSYDNTGCFDSDGEDIVCLSQSLADLDAAVAHLKNEGILGKFRNVYVIGHSWGGFAAGNIASFHPEIKKAVVIAGFISVKNLLLGVLRGGGAAKDPVINKILSFEEKAAPKYRDASFISAVKNSKTKFLFVYSKNDPAVSYKYNAEQIPKAENTQFIIYPDRLHNPNYTLDAVTYMTKTFADFNKAKLKLRTLKQKQEFFKSADWIRMTRQDEDFWQQVTEFLEKNN